MADVSNSKLYSFDKGIPQIKDAFIVLVRTDWNAEIVDELEAGANGFLNELGMVTVKTVSVPGAFEIPYAIKTYYDLAEKKPDAFIALGCVIKGDTPHFEYVCNAITDGVGNLNLQLPVPTIFGVLTVNTHEQALERIGGKHGHKGEEAAITALKMIAFKENINSK